MTSEGGDLGLRRLGAQGPRSLGSREMRVGEEKGAEHKTGSGDREGTCVWGGGGQRRRKGGEGGGDTGSWEGA